MPPYDKDGPLPVGTPVPADQLAAAEAPMTDGNAGSPVEASENEPPMRDHASTSDGDADTGIVAEPF